MKDYYQLLGVGKNAPLAEIKKSYRKLARKYHPDLNPGDKASEQKFKEINEAYEILKDSEKRKQFDNFGSVGPNSAGSRAQASDFEGFDFTTSGTSTFGDIFETIFGGGGNPAEAQAGRKTKRAERGEDLQYSMNLSFMDAAKGIETPIQIVRREACRTCGGAGIDPDSSRMTCSVCKGKGRIQRQTGFMKFGTVCSNCGGAGYLPGHPCRVCQGEGRIEALTRLRVRIPAGVDDGSKVRINGKGNAGKDGGPEGDLIIVIHVTPHHLFRRSGANIELTLPVTYTEAALGAKLEIPTIDGPMLFKVPPGTASGQKLRLKGKGIVAPKRGAPGDMIVEVKIIPPSTKDIKVRELLKEIERISPYDPREGLHL